MNATGRSRNLDVTYGGRVHWLRNRLAASRAHRVICLLIGIWLISILDVGFTVWSHNENLLGESNPIAACVLQLGPAAIIVYKLGLVAFASVVLLTHRALLVCEVVATGALLANAMVAIQWHFCFEIYLVTKAITLSIANGTPIVSPS